MYDTTPQIKSIVENGDGHNQFTFQACISYSFLNFFPFFLRKSIIFHALKN